MLAGDDESRCWLFVHDRDFARALTRLNSGDGCVLGRVKMDVKPARQQHIHRVVGPPGMDNNLAGLDFTDLACAQQRLNGRERHVFEQA